MDPKPLPPEFYSQDPVTVAKELVGKGLMVQKTKSIFVAEIVETEAYLGETDPASHAFRGQNKRNWAMFEAGGTCYVYLCYGTNFCVNVVTGTKGKGEAVLLRAAIPISGIEEMKRNRGVEKVKDLLSGPGKLTRAMGIDLGDNGKFFAGPELRLFDFGRRPELASSCRIGISKAKEEPFRFFVRNSPWISRKG